MPLTTLGLSRSLCCWCCSLALLLWFLCRCSGGTLCWCRCICFGIVLESSNVCFVLNEDCYNFTERHIFGSLWIQECCYISFFLHLKINHGFISLDSSQDITWGNLVSHLFIPFLDVTLKMTHESSNIVLTFSIVGERFGISRVMWSG